MPEQRPLMPQWDHAPASTVLSSVEEAMIVEFLRRTLLPIDDVLGCLRDSIMPSDGV